MRMVTDSREQAPLVFPKVEGVTYEVKGLPVGDYTAGHLVEGKEVMDTTVIERKGVIDCFNSFTGDNYDRERAKILRAKDLGLGYIIAVEASVTELLQGCSWWAKGERHEHRKTGMAMLRQLCSLERRYGVQVWYCSSRSEMALRIIEFFLAQERIPDARKVPSHT